jgi:hypothetical protein
MPLRGKCRWSKRFWLWPELHSGNQPAGKRGGKDAPLTAMPPPRRANQRGRGRNHVVRQSLYLRDELRMCRLFSHVMGFYNRRRRHSAPSYEVPVIHGMCDTPTLHENGYCPSVVTLFFTTLTNLSFDSIQSTIQRTTQVFTFLSCSDML